MKIGGCYTLRRALPAWEGGAAWVANDEVLGKDVVLNFVPAAIVNDARAMSELRQEVKRNRQLIHPNILRVYDLVEDGANAAISMDCIEGETLSERLKKSGRLNPEDIKPWASQLAETLADAHRIHLFHRDLAPVNLVARPGGGVTVKNFGTSRVILSSIERAGLAKGDSARVAYLSPQQIDGDKPCASDDIYGFGVLLYELLTGQPPFVGENLVPQVRKAVPPSIGSVRSAAGVPGQVPAGIEKIIAACLQKNPEMRPRNWSEVVAMLGHDSGKAETPAVAAGPASVATEISSLSAGGPTPTPTEEAQPVKQTEPASTAGEIAADSGAVQRLSESSSDSRKAAETIFPPPPPGAPWTDESKSPSKGTLSPGFPDLDRPKSKAPLVWLLLAAGVIGAGIYVRNTPDDTDIEAANNAVERINGEGEVPAVPENEPKSVAPLVPGTSNAKIAVVNDRLPDPVPVKPTPNPGAGGKVPDSGTPGTSAAMSSGTSGTAPKATPGALAVAKPDGGEPGPVLPGGSSVVAPETLMSVSAGAQDLGTRPSTQGGTAAKMADSTGAAKVASSTKQPGAQKETKPAGSTDTKSPLASNATPTPKPAPEVKPPDVAKATPTPPGKIDPATKPAAPAVAATTKLPELPVAPKALPKLVLSTKATIADLELAKKERALARDEVLAVAGAADKAHEETSRRLALVRQEKEKTEKALEARRKVLAPILQGADASEAERKKLSDEAAKAAAAAAEAARAAEAAKRRLEEAVAKNADKARASEEAQKEMQSAAAGLAALAREVDELSQFVTKADALRQQARSAQMQLDDDLIKVSSTEERVRRAEKEAFRKANQAKIAAVEKQVKDLEVQMAKFKTALASLKELGEAGTDIAAKTEEKMADTAKLIGALKTEIKNLSGEGVEIPAAPKDANVPPKAAPTPAPAPTPKPAVAASATDVKPAAPAPAPNAPEVKPALPAPTPQPADTAKLSPTPTPTPKPVEMVKLSPTPTPTPSEPVKPVEPASAEKVDGNSLGMKFAPVGDVQFAVNLTTRKQFEGFAAAANLKSEAWRNPGFKQADDHPVVNVTWKEADAFCKWLTEKERKAGLLKTNESYRLPTDIEWSKAVGLPAETGATPEDRDMGVPDVYPWGNQWPPPKGAGNYAGEETQTEIPIQNYDDGFPNTSPVGSFPANKLGLYDMGGNVWQWVSDYWNAENRAKTLRGGSWYNGAIPLSLLSSCRISSSPDTLHDTYGFRIVKAVEPAKTKRRN